MARNSCSAKLKVGTAITFSVPLRQAGLRLPNDAAAGDRATGDLLWRSGDLPLATFFGVGVATRDLVGVGVRGALPRLADGVGDVGSDRVVNNFS